MRKGVDQKVMRREVRKSFCSAKKGMSYRMVGHVCHKLNNDQRGSFLQKSLTGPES